jgi:hypothetical protein
MHDWNVDFGNGGISLEVRNKPLFWGTVAVLAAWFRLKYPHVAIGALASSSPILNFENITSPYSFNNIITQDFRVPPLLFNLNYSLNLNSLLVFLPQLEIMIRFVIRS